MGVNSNGTVMMDQGVFENLGSVTWDTTAKTTGFTAVSGNGYFVNTTSGAITVTLPSSPSAGDLVGIKDYANTADTNAITIGRNGSNIDGVANDFTITTEGLSALLVYVDATKGWLITNSSQASDISQSATFITATGGTITTCGDYKIHTFTSPGTFTVTQAANPAGGPNNVDYLVVAGGGGGAGAGGCTVSAGGGGAGGHRSGFPSPAGTTPVSVQGYPITVGGGGSGGPGSPAPNLKGSDGSSSSGVGITSAGGGAGGQNNAANAGGSGGGSSYSGGSPGAGNTPPVSPPQGNPGGATNNGSAGSGGGGIGAAGTPHPGLQFPSSNGTPGGNGVANSINGSSVTRAGGGGGGGFSNNFPTPSPQPGIGGSGGSGGGGTGGTSTRFDSGSPGGNATTNTGGGGGGSGSGGTNSPINRPGGNGGSGIVIIRYKYQ